MEISYAYSRLSVQVLKYVGITKQIFSYGYVQNEGEKKKTKHYEKTITLFHRIEKEVHIIIIIKKR